MPISAVNAISPAIEHAKRQVFEPFRFGQWARLALVGFLAGELSSGGGNFNFNYPSGGHPHGSDQHLSAAVPPHLAHHHAMFVGLFAVIFVVVLALCVLFIYINSIMRFILFDSILAKECHIRKGWVRRRPEGRLYFVWQILFALVSFAAVIIVIGVPLATAWAMGWFVNPGEHLLRLILGGIALFLIFLVLAVLLAVVQVMTKDFVVPQMALEGVSAFEGWRRLWPWMKAEKGGYAGYIGMKIVLSIAAAIVFGIITLFAFLMLLIPIGGLGVAAVLGGKAAGWIWNVQTITLAVILGCLVLALLLFVASMISVPAIVFFPAYSIYFFAGRYPPLAALLWPPRPASSP